MLREAESDDTVVEICRKHGINQQTFYLWKKKKYAGLGLSELRDQYTRECATLLADNTLGSEKGATAPDKALLQRDVPESITVDNGTEFTSKALDHWAYRNGVRLDFIRPGRPVKNGFIESFNGKLRDECLNMEVFFNLADARRKVYLWRRDYNHHRPHSALDDRTPAEFAATCRRGKDDGQAALENAVRLPLSLRPTTTLTCPCLRHSLELREPQIRTSVGT